MKVTTFILIPGLLAGYGRTPMNLIMTNPRGSFTGHGGGREGRT